MKTKHLNLLEMYEEGDVCILRNKFLKVADGILRLEIIICGNRNILEVIGLFIHTRKQL